MPPEVICTGVRLRFLHDVADPTEENFQPGFNVEALRRVLAPLIAPDLRAKVSGFFPREAADSRNALESFLRFWVHNSSLLGSISGNWTRLGLPYRFQYVARCSHVARRNYIAGCGHCQQEPPAGASWRFQNLEKQELREARTWRNQNGGVADRRFEEDHML